METKIKTICIVTKNHIIMETKHILFVWVAIKVVDKLPEVELKKLGDIRDLAREFLKRGMVAKRAASNMVAKISKELKGKWPVRRRNVMHASNMFPHGLQILDISLSRVFVLVVRFRLSITNYIVSQDRVDFLTGLNTGRVSP